MTTETKTGRPPLPKSRAKALDVVAHRATCAYCAWVGPDRPIREPNDADEREHLAVCPKNPARAVEGALSALHAEHQRTQAQAAALRRALEESCPYTQPKMARGPSVAMWLRMRAIVEHALISEAGKGWVSPEEHQRVVAERDEAVAKHQTACGLYCCDSCSQPARDGEIQNGKRVCIRCVAAQRDYARRAVEAKEETKEGLYADNSRLRSQLAEVTQERDDYRHGCEELTKERDEARALVGMKERIAQMYFEKQCGDTATHDSLRAALAASEEKAREMREALELLLAVQNGPPLLKYEREWNAAMEMGQRALSPSAAPASEEPKR